jgi:choice-of-anchor B domain-containing protein
MFRRTAVAAALLLGALALAPPAPSIAQPATRNITLQAHLDDYPAGSAVQNYSACWSYIHGDGREYALLGVNGVTTTTGGTAIYNVSDPSSPHLVGFIAGPQSTWREIKSYRNWIYVVTEGLGTGQGLQIIRMTNPESPALAATYTTNFVRSHTVAVDTTRGILVCNGTRNASGQGSGMRILALNNPGIGAAPESPVEIASWPATVPNSNDEYIHDSVPVGNRLYASSIYPGIQRIFDVTNPATPTQISSWTYPGGFTHNSWPDATGNWLYVTDEVKGEPLKVFDLSNLASPSLAYALTSNPQAIVHNAHVRGGELYLSNYTEGIRVLDLSDPCHPAEFAWADSYAGPSGGYSGVWEVCPYFPSGTVIASDRNTGLYVYRVVHDYGILRVHVVDAGTGLPVSGAMVTLAPQGDSLETHADGIVRFAPNPGTATVLAHSFGWADASETRTVSQGSFQELTLTIVPRPVVNFAGVVRSAAGGAPLDGAQVSLAYTDLHEHIGPSGAYALDVPDDTYQLEIRRPGTIPIVLQRRIGPLYPGSDYSLRPAAGWLDMESAAGWTVGAAGDDASSGVWTLATPLGTGTRPPESGLSLASGDARARPSGAATRGMLPVMEAASARGAGPLDAQHEEPAAAAVNAAPYLDRSPPPGTKCWVTGQGTDSTNFEQADVDGGKTTLTTPALDLTGMTTPTIGYWRWFCSWFPTGISIGHNGPDVDDYLAVLISNDNGASWTPVDTTRGLLNHWEERAVRVADYVTPTAQVKLRFVAADAGFPTTVEAAIDDLSRYDGALAPVGTPGSGRKSRLALGQPWPNPSSGVVHLVLEMSAAGRAVVEVLDLAGRRVRVLHRGMAGPGPLTLAWDGRDESGRHSPAGLYFARAAVGDEERLARFVRAR